MQNFVEKLSSENLGEVIECLDTFCRTHTHTVLFNDFNGFEEREQVWRLIFRRLANHTENMVHCSCLEVLRILSRDKTDLDELITDERLSLIIYKANLNSSSQYLTSHEDDEVEALKLLCNLIFNSQSVQIQILKTNCLDNLMKRISYYTDIPTFIKNNNSKILFEIRILFLVTALNSKSRNSIKDDNGDIIMMNILDKLCEELKISIDELSKDKIIEVICEILKTLFNLLLDCDEKTDNEKLKYENLVNILYKLLLIDTIEEDLKKDELHSHIINLFTVIPSNCFSPIIPIFQDTTTTSNNKNIYENNDMTAIYKILLFLNKRLDNDNNYLENISPVIVALLKLSKSQRIIRKFSRNQVLPPLKNVMQRPEDGTTLRAKLCKLLTTPLTEIRDLVAEFLFVLCKENVGRMVKYTGYGNAAGMFANKGLLGGKQPETEYSSESGDSDTDEYTKIRNDINPVTGCYERPKQNPMEGMSEEQKEYEAMKLVNLVNQLANGGMIKPCTVGEDGKPKPVQHVLQLQEGISRNPGNKNSSDSE
ncbi:synembryn [Aphidius gifuensis]|uniref:synembryn n=1 Tax=Aphidius gifuensis TaxID=684658 RepID=UPI001CDCF446|nr:synembryn [Aphidius gifuensis]